MTAPTPRRAPDPIRDTLSEVRRGLLRLHKSLIDAERAAFERSRGPVTNSQLLQSLIEDPFFAWLRPYSQLIVEIDEALASREEPVTPDAARGFVGRVRELVTVPDEHEQTMSRYEEVRSRHPDVLIAHVEIHNRIDNAQKALDA